VPQCRSVAGLQGISVQRSALQGIRVAGHQRQGYRSSASASASAFSVPAFSVQRPRASVPLPLGLPLDSWTDEQLKRFHSRFRSNSIAGQLESLTAQTLGLGLELLDSNSGLRA